MRAKLSQALAVLKSVVTGTATKAGYHAKKARAGRRTRRLVRTLGAVLVSVLAYVNLDLDIVWKPRPGGHDVEVHVKTVPTPAVAGGEAR